MTGTGTGTEAGTGTDCRPEELLIAVIAGLLEGCRHIAVGVSSPIPGSAALLRRQLDGGATRVSIIGSEIPEFRTDGGIDLFDCAGQGRIDAFFLSGGQIDGRANINLVGVGEYPQQKVRWSGSFGSAYLYFTVPKVILFREEHTPRVLVDKVDFISAPGVSPANVHRPGGPVGLVTTRCVFAFDRAKRALPAGKRAPRPQRRRGSGADRLRLRLPGGGAGDAAARRGDPAPDPRDRRAADRRPLSEVRPAPVGRRRGGLNRTSAGSLVLP